MTGTHAAIIALLTSFNILANLVSLATLFVYYLVAIAFMWRRYWPGCYSPEVITPADPLCCLAQALLTVHVLRCGILR